MNKLNLVTIIVILILIINSIGKTEANHNIQEDSQKNTIEEIVSGRICGTNVLLKNSSFENSQLAIYSGDNWAFNPSILIFLFTEKNSIPSNKVFTVSGENSSNSQTPHIHYRWKDRETGQIKTEIITQGYSLNLQFGRFYKEKLYGKIKLEAPQKDISIEGSFVAKVKQHNITNTQTLIKKPNIIGKADYTTPLIQQLQNAYKLQKKGNYDEAIKIYSGILVNSKADRKYIARAYYRIGQCFIKSENEIKAIELFQYLMSAFPDQKSSVAKAKMELRKLRKSKAGKYKEKTGTLINESAPKIINSKPVLFANDVSPNLDEISFTFDTPMKDGNWSWAKFDTNSYPEMVGKPFFENNLKTCTQQVKLKPGTIYMIGINQKQEKVKVFEGIGVKGGFQSAYGKLANPYVLVFATRAVDGKPTTIPEDFIAKAKKMNQGIESLESFGKKVNTKRVQKISGKELSHVNVKETENLKYSSGPDNIVKFKTPFQDAYLKGIWVYGFRSKHAKKDNFVSHLLLCDKDLNVIEDFPFATIEFSDKYRHWVGLELSPKKKLPSEFIIRMNSSERTINVGFNPLLSGCNCFNRKKLRKQLLQYCKKYALKRN